MPKTPGGVVADSLSGARYCPQLGTDRAGEHWWGSEHGAAPRFLRALPAVLVVGGVLFDLGTPDPFTAAPFFSAAPLIAAPFFSLRAVLVPGVAVVAAAAGLHAYGALEAVAQRLERALTREGTRRQGLDAFEGFTTAALAEIPCGAQDRIRVVNRGHPEPLLLYADGGLDAITPTDPALPLGMADLASWPDHADELTFPPGATLLLYTDGLSEARNTAGVFYEPKEWLRGRIFPGPAELLIALSDDVRLHTGGHSTDDMALLAVARPTEDQPARRRTEEIVRGHRHSG